MSTAIPIILIVAVLVFAWYAARHPSEIFGGLFSGFFADAPDTDEERGDDRDEP